MKKLLQLSLSSAMLLACAATVPVDPSNQIGDQNGKPMYSVTNGRTAHQPKYGYRANEAAIIRNYCPNGGTKIRETTPVSTGKMTSMQRGRMIYREPWLQYDIIFVCN